MLRLPWGSASDVGRVRSNNQDARVTTERVLAVAEQVEAGVADVQPGERLVAVIIDDGSDGDERGAHAAQLGILGGPVPHDLVGDVGGLHESVAGWLGEADR